MIILIEIAAGLLAAALLFMPVITLPYMLFRGSLFEDSAFALAYLAIAATFVFGWFFGQHLWRQAARWLQALLFFISVPLVAAASTALVFLIAALADIDAVDSSHGGSIIMVVMSALGLALIGAVVFAERRRRAL